MSGSNCAPDCADELEPLVRLKCDAVRARRAHRGVGVRDRDDARGERDRHAY